MNKNQKQNNNEEIRQNKPAYSFFLHVSDLDYNSKRHLNAFELENNYKNIITFDTKKEILNGIDFSNSKEKPLFTNFQINENSNINNNILNINQAINQNNESYNNNSNINSNNCYQQQNQNKKILAKPKRKKQQKNIKNKNNKKPRNSSYISNNCYLSKKSKIKSKSSQSSDRSGNSTKRTNNLLKTRLSPEKYPEDYYSVEGSDEEKELKKEEIQINQNSNTLLIKNILEKGKIINNDFEPKKNIEQILEGFDLMSVDLKSMIRDRDFKKKYFKNFKADIKIVYFDKETFPLHAIFIFNDKNIIIKRDKKLFPGAYNKDEFIEFCSKMIMKNTNVKVELLMDYAEFPKYQDLQSDLNINLFIDFYFLVDILIED